MNNHVPIILITSLILFSCKTENKKNMERGEIDFANTVYYFTSNFDSTNCKVFSACDCCSENIVFLNESEFITISYCLGNEGYFKGNYVILDSTLQLNFNKFYVLNEYNWEYELDTTGTIKNQYNIKKLKCDERPKRLDIFFCKKEVCLKGRHENQEYYGVIDTLQVEDIIGRMKKGGIWQNL